MPAITFVPDQPATTVHASLRQSLRAVEKAQQCAVLWFAEIMHRQLYREFDCSSINQYAMKKLGFSKSRTRDFVRLAGQLDLTPEQEARRAALVERLHKLGGVPADRAELMLEALASLVEAKEKGPRGPLASAPPVQIHVHENEDGMTVQTQAGERQLSRAESERMRFDAAICLAGGRNTTTIRPRVRREVLARDKHRCRAPGCGRTRFLEVHHLTPRKRGGGNRPENLITLCSSCHRLWHEKRTQTTVELGPPNPV